MNKLNQLINKYPKLFRENFHFECNEGWYNLIDNICERVYKFVNKDEISENEIRELAYSLWEERGSPIGNPNIDWKYAKELLQEEVDIYVAQIKEKFGGLRFYINNGNDEIYEIIHEVEDESFSICEYCGNEGELRRNRSWLKTLCNECNLEEKKFSSIKI